MRKWLIKLLKRIRHRLVSPSKIKLSALDEKRLRQVVGHERDKLVRELHHKYNKKT